MKNQTPSDALRRTLTLARRLNTAEQNGIQPVVEPSPGWSRRRLLQKLGLLTGAVAFPSVPTTLRASSGPAPRIVILGAGLAGLNAAYQLKKRGLASTVYEARSRVGGRVHTVRDVFGPGSLTEMGAEFVNSNHADMLSLAEDFGIGLFDRLAEGDTTGLPAAAYLVGGQVLSEETVAEALRTLARRIGRDSALLDRNPDHFYPRFDVITAAEYLDDNADALPEPWVRALIEQTIRTEYGVEPEQASSLVLLYNLPVVDGQEVELLGGSDERYAVVGGSGAITDAMAAFLGGSVRTGRAATAIARVGDGYRVTFAQGPAVEADILVCALPLTVLRRMSLNLGLPAKFDRFIREVDLGVNEKVIAGVTSRFWRTQGRFANEFWATEAFASGWDSSQRQPSLAGGSLTFYTGSDDSLSALQGPVGAKAAAFVATLSGYYPEASGAASGTALRTNWLNDPWTGGSYANFGPGQTTEFGEYSWYEDAAAPQYNQEVRFDNAYFIGEHTSSEYYGFMNGGAETGRRAAQSILSQRGLL
jgi:monoamine oxidase